MGEGGGAGRKVAAETIAPMHSNFLRLCPGKWGSCSPVGSNTYAGDLSRSKRTKLALDWPLALLCSGFCPLLYDRGNLVPWWPLPKLQASVKSRDQSPDCQTHVPL